MRPRNVNPKRRYRMLPLDFPFTEEKEFWEECVEKKPKLATVFHKDGFYYDRQTQLTWLEIDGQAWQYSDPEYFKFELAVNKGNNRIHPDAFNAITAILKEKLGNKALKEIHYTETCIRELRATYVEAKLFCMKSLKEFELQQKDEE